MPEMKTWRSLGCNHDFYVQTTPQHLNCAAASSSDVRHPAGVAFSVGRQDADRTCICLSRRDALEFVAALLDMIEQNESDTSS